MRKSVSLGVLWVGLTCLVAQATPVMDAVFAPANDNFYAAFGDLTRAQTFTVGASGLLSRFEVLINTTDAEVQTRLFEIHPTTAGVPVLGSTPLASAVITYGPSAGTQFYGADIGSFGVDVSPGDVLAIVDPGTGPTDAWWAGRTSNGLYAGGQWYTTINLYPSGGISTEYSGYPDTDLGFRTYVDAGNPDGGSASVPAPGALLLAGFGAICTAIRRRR